MKFRDREKEFLSTTFSKLGEYIFAVVVLGQVVSNHYRPELVIGGFGLYIICTLAGYILISMTKRGE